MCIMNRHVASWEGGGGRNKNMEMKSEIVINILCQFPQPPAQEINIELVAL